VRTEQPSEVALSTLNSFERTLPLVTLVGIVIALLLSTVQIRRSHRPLALLTDAVEHVGRRGVHRHVTIDSKDEYGNLAQAFNRMAGSLARQFELFRTLAQIDRMILDDPTTELLVEKDPAVVARLLRAPVVAVASLRAMPGDTIWWSLVRATAVRNVQTDALKLVR
jgi:nitrogen fixation/metabolism regulation signal transduction histidine kinase